MDRLLWLLSSTYHVCWANSCSWSPGPNAHDSQWFISKNVQQPMVVPNDHDMFYPSRSKMGLEARIYDLYPCVDIVSRNSYPMWWFQIFLFSHLPGPYLREMIQFDEYFSNGLVQPLPSHPTVVGSNPAITSWGNGSLSTIIYNGFYTSQEVVWDFWTINSMSGLF